MAHAAISELCFEGWISSSPKAACGAKLPFVGNPLLGCRMDMLSRRLRWPLDP